MTYFIIISVSIGAVLKFHIFNQPIYLAPLAVLIPVIFFYNGRFNIDKLKINLDPKATYSFPVKYSSEKNFKKIFTFVPWESKGTLSISKSKFVFKSENNKKVEFEPLNENLEWKGTESFKAAWNWFLIRENGNNHYFTAECGPLVINSEKATKTLFHQIKFFVDNART